jgi:gamma-glutamyltranspeptidase/glutathione hydrolase
VRSWPCEVGAWGEEADWNAVVSRFGHQLPGVAPCIVPGAPAGWLCALADHGTWSFAEVVAPAAELALDGFPVACGCR